MVQKFVDHQPLSQAFLRHWVSRQSCGNFKLRRHGWNSDAPGFKAGLVTRQQPWKIAVFLGGKSIAFRAISSIFYVATCVSLLSLLCDNGETRPWNGHWKNLLGVWCCWMFLFNVRHEKIGHLLKQQKTPEACSSWRKRDGFPSTLWFSHGAFHGHGRYPQVAGWWFSGKIRHSNQPSGNLHVFSRSFSKGWTVPSIDSLFWISPGAFFCHLGKWLSVASYHMMPM